MAEPELSLGGLPLLFDLQQQAGDFQRLYQPLEDTIIQIEQSIAQRADRSARGSSGILFPLPNYPPPPAPRVNQLYWPTGAARWARGYFLATKTVAEQFNTCTEEGGEPVDALTLKAIFADITLETTVYALQPRPVSCVPNVEGFWLIPVVDERYWWQFKHAGEFNDNAFGSWSALFSYLATQLGISISVDAVPTAYLKPDRVEFLRSHENAAILLDAAAHSVGQRIVRQLDGTVRSINFTNSATEQGLNITSRTPWQQIAGDPLADPVVPASITVIFPKLNCGLPDFTGEKHSETLTSGDFSSACTLDNAIKTIHSTAWAEMDGSDTPSNNSELDLLTERIATDYYASLAQSYDYTFAGVKQWYFTGYDDHALFSFGTEDAQPILTANVDVHKSGEEEVDASAEISCDYQRLCLSRFQSSPLNFGVDRMLHQGDNNSVDDSRVAFGDLTEAVCPADNTTVYTDIENVVTWNGTRLDPDTVRAVVKMGCRGIAGDRAILLRVTPPAEEEPEQSSASSQSSRSNVEAQECAQWECVFIECKLVSPLINVFLDLAAQKLKGTRQDIAAMKCNQPYNVNLADLTTQCPDVGGGDSQTSTDCECFEPCVCCFPDSPAELTLTLSGFDGGGAFGDCCNALNAAHTLTIDECKPCRWTKCVPQFCYICNDPLQLFIEAKFIDPQSSCECTQMIVDVSLSDERKKVWLFLRMKLTLQEPLGASDCCTLDHDLSQQCFNTNLCCPEGDYIVGHIEAKCCTECCEPVQQTMELTLSGITGSSACCTTLNATHTLTYDANHCEWSKTEADWCTGTTLIIKARMQDDCERVEAEVELVETDCRTLYLKFGMPLDVESSQSSVSTSSLGDCCGQSFMLDLECCEAFDGATSICSCASATAILACGGCICCDALNDALIGDELDVVISGVVSGTGTLTKVGSEDGECFRYASDVSITTDGGACLMTQPEIIIRCRVGQPISGVELNIRSSASSHTCNWLEDGVWIVADSATCDDPCVTNAFQAVWTVHLTGVCPCGTGSAITITITKPCP